jgi:23S rRNA pseudoU1915 N3-methylase RlmH
LLPESKSQVATFLDKIAMTWQLATLAQLVEQLPRKEQVRSSILLGGSRGVPKNAYLGKLLAHQTEDEEETCGSKLSKLCV